MKGNLLIFCSLLLSFSANAGRITMSILEQTTTENSRTLCCLLKQHLHVYLHHQVEAL